MNEHPPEKMTEKEAVKAALNLLRNEQVSYTNDSLYGATMLLDSYFNENLSLEEALNELLANSQVQLKVEEK